MSLRQISADQERILLGLLERITSLTWKEDQGGHAMYRGNGQWMFSTTGVAVTPEEINTAFEVLGQSPVKIEPLGSCSTCAFAENGRERGYKAPCVRCKRPVMSEYQPATGEVVDA